MLNGEAWSVSLNILLPEGGSLDQFCWSWNVNNGTSSYVGLINQPNNLNWYFEKVRSSTCKVSSHAGLAQGQWHNVTVTSDAEATSIYVDGQLRNTKSPNKTALSLNNSTKAWLGRSPFDADARLTNTFMDDFAVYDCALTPEQVLALYEVATQKASDCEALQPVPDTEPNAEAVNLIGGGTEVEITSLLKNPDFSNGNEGWEGTPFSAAPGTVAEHFYQLFDTYQVLPNMPAGRYRLEWQGFYRNGNIQNAWLRHSEGTETRAEVYANEAATPMLSLYDASAPYTYDPYTYPDNVETANNAFAAGHYLQQLEFELTAQNDLRIGIRHFAPAVYDWTCFDNFRLFYIDSTTGIKGIGQLDNLQFDGATGAVYDLAGRRIAQSSIIRSAQSDASRLKNHRSSIKKGLYIINGKKVIIR